MPHFQTSFTVRAPVEAVRAFHHDASVLPRLSPPPIFVRLQRFDPLAEGSVAAFTMWFGPAPVRWEAVHSDVGPQGFTDEQRVGPLQRWRHRHRFVALDAQTTRVEETIEYGHRPGWRGWLTRLVFNRPGLAALFAYRALVTRRAVEARGERFPVALVAGLGVLGWRCSRRRRE